jgi:chromosome segregation ATPase
LRGELELRRGEHEAAVARLGQEAESLRARHEAEVAELRQGLEATRSSHECERAQLSREAEELRAGHKADLEAVAAEWEGRVREQADASARLTEECEGLRETLDAAEKRHRDDLEAFERGQSESHSLLDAARADQERLKAEREDARAEAGRHAGRVQELEDRHAGEVARLTERMTQLTGDSEDFASQIDTLRAELDRERQARAADSHASTERLASLRGEWDAERAAWSREKATLAAARPTTRAGDDQVRELEEQLRILKAQADRNAADARDSALALLAIESDLNEKDRKIEELNFSLSQAQNYKHQVKDYLIGLGIQLPN